MFIFKLKFTSWYVDNIICTESKCIENAKQTFGSHWITLVRMRDNINSSLWCSLLRVHPSSFSSGPYTSLALRRFSLFSYRPTRSSYPPITGTAHSIHSTSMSDMQTPIRMLLMFWRQSKQYITYIAYAVRKVRSRRLFAPSENSVHFKPDYDTYLLW